MKYLKLIVAILVLMIAATGSAWADHGRFRSHVFVGVGVGPYWDPWYYYPPPAYYYPPPVYYYPPPPVVYASPPVYVERARSPAPSANNYWYYCAASKRYYPYVTECPGGWRRVAPTPPDSR